MRGAFGLGKNFSPDKNQRNDTLKENNGSVVQIRDEHSGGLKSNRLAKQLRKDETLKLKRLNTGASISGFIKPLSS